MSMPQSIITASGNATLCGTADAAAEADPGDSRRGDCNNIMG